MAKRKSDPLPETPAPSVIIDLVDRFARNRDAYRAGKYNETQVRREFIDPMFKALGWDIDNEQGYAEAYKDVVHEDAIRIGGAVKAPDYCFRIGGTRKFFLEAKKPSVDIKGDPTPAFQLRRYAWSGKLPLSVLTDFEEFAVYDCRVKPDKSDKSSAARIIYHTFDQYTDPKVWHSIASVFSRDAILKGSFDKYAQSAKRKRGTAEVDDAFLAEIESWRSELARNIALRNSSITHRELNAAVQLTVDRIIFLRICEDRGIEDYGRLQGLLNGDRVYKRLFELLEKADQRYNSGLFYFKAEKGRGPADTLTPSLTIDDKVLKGIIKGLYYPESPYEFSVLPADILGHVYEQFLGKVIRLTKGHRAEIEEKPEVRKAGGVYYTPTYIVDYIVKHTVGELLKGASVKWVGTEKGKAVEQPRLSRTLRVLDPACGSGSFLIGAYQYLLDWYLGQYIENEPEKWAKRSKPPIAANQKGEYRLTTPERKRILLEHIYGVDIDAQAVEVTKLSLLLKVLEGETAHSLGTHLWYEKERALPDLSANIKCGNSLIGPDFYTNQQQQMFDEEERYRINAFDWKAEFAEVFAGGKEEGGFDAVIGNPPYIFTRELLTKPERAYFSHHYERSFEKHNTYMLFMEAMLRLLANGGLGSYIVPNSWLTIESAKLLRAFVASRIRSVLDLNYQVFDQVSMEPCVFCLSASEVIGPVLALRVSGRPDILTQEVISIDRSPWVSGDGRFTFSNNEASSGLAMKVAHESRRLESVFDVRTGLQAYERGKGAPPQTAADVRDHVFDRTHQQDTASCRYLQGGDVGRYQLNWSGMWMQYGPWLAQPRELSMFTRPRVLLREITGRLPQCIHAVVATACYLSNKSVLTVLHESDDVQALTALMAVLNSRLLSLYYKERAVKSSRNVFPKIVIRNLREFPLPKIWERGAEPDAALQPLAVSGQHMLDQHKRLAVTKTAHEREIIRRDIDATDRQIDRLVYDLYGLTDAEIAIVEEATGGKA